MSYIHEQDCISQRVGRIARNGLVAMLMVAAFCVSTASDIDDAQAASEALQQLAKAEQHKANIHAKSEKIATDMLAQQGDAR